MQSDSEDDVYYDTQERGSVFSSISSLSEENNNTNSNTSSNRNSENSSPSSPDKLKPQLSTKRISIETTLSNDANTEIIKELTDRFEQIFENSKNNSNIIKENNPNGKTKVNTNISFDNLKLQQTIQYHNGPIWACKVSPDGKYICTAGQDTKVIVWSIGSNSEIKKGRSPSGESSNHGSDDFDFNEDSQSIDSKEDNTKSTTKPFNNNIVNTTPYRVYEGHTADVIDIAWSKSNFILSASVDQHVILWLVSRNERITQFRHPDIVTSVDFHPIHDRYFITGCFDKRIRLYDIIPDGSVRSWVQASDIVTSVCFSSDAQTIVGGLINGQVFFYSFDLKYITQMNCKNSRGKYKTGRKITGLYYLKPNLQTYTSLKTINDTNNSITSNKDKLLITSNDNRLRLIQIENYSLLSKYRNIKNNSMQIKATVSDDNKYIISGSDNGFFHIWSINFHTNNKWFNIFNRHNNYTNSENISIQCSDSSIAITTAIFAPYMSVYHILAHDKVDYFLSTITNVNMETTESYELYNELKNSIDNFLYNKISMYPGNDFCTRLIITTDYNGIIRIYVRQT